MTVLVGAVRTFPDAQADKEQAKKILEESAEVFGALQRWQEIGKGLRFSRLETEQRAAIVDECADVIQAACNMVAALGVTDLTPFMAACEERNRKRGRYERNG